MWEEYFVFVGDFSVLFGPFENEEGAKKWAERFNAESTLCGTGLHARVVERNHLSSPPPSPEQVAWDLRGACEELEGKKRPLKKA